MLKGKREPLDEKRVCNVPCVPDLNDLVPNIVLVRKFYGTSPIAKFFKARTKLLKPQRYGSIFFLFSLGNGLNAGDGGRGSLRSFLSDFMLCI